MTLAREVLPLAFFAGFNFLDAQIGSGPLELHFVTEHFSKIVGVKILLYNLKKLFEFKVLILKNVIFKEENIRLPINSNY